MKYFILIIFFISTLFSSSDQGNKNTFTNEEINWIKNNPKISIAGDPYWPPYSFYDEKGNYIGIIPDLVNEIFKDSGINLEYVKTDKWSDTIDSLKNKKIDIIDAISYSVSRNVFLDFSDKYIGAEIVLIASNKEKNYVSAFDNISNKRIGSVKGYSIIEQIKNDYPKISDIVEYNSPLEGLKGLLNSQIDYMILDIPTFEFYSKKFSLSNLKIVGPAGYNYSYGFGIQKDNLQLLSIVNKLLDNLSLERKNEIYSKWIKIDYKEKIDYSLIWKIIAFAILFLAGTLFWNRKLKHQIEEKEKIQKELEDERTYIKSLNAELIKSNEIAKSAAKHKTEFLANMSHEIRTPMNSIIGFAEILDKEIQNPVHKEYLSSIKKGGNALLAIINDILDLSKIEAGKLNIKKETINPSKMFLEIESIFHGKIISKNISFIVEIDKNIPKYIREPLKI